MKVIDLSNNIIFVDDIDYIKKSITYENSGFIYFKSNREPLKISDYYGNIYKGDYTKVVNYLKSLNDELEIIEDTPKEDIPTSKLYKNNKLQYDLTPKEDKKIEKLNEHIFVDAHSIVLKINEIIDKVNKL